MKFPQTKKTHHPLKPSKKITPSKPHSKTKKPQTHQPTHNIQAYNDDESINSSEIVSNNDQYHPQPDNHNNLSAQQIKLNIAKQLLSDTKKSIKTKNVQNDDFFMAEPTENIDEEELIAQELKNQYLRDKNKLYADRAKQFGRLRLCDVVRYKGHTKCITCVEVTDTEIFSASKDKSIIRWDRETGQKDFITKGNSDIVVGDHVAPILSISYHPRLSLLATASEDCLIKLWDIRTPKVIETLKGHRGAVTGIKFGDNSNNLCSVSADKTFKQWDCAQRGLLQTFYGHNYQILDLDSINSNDFISSGNDHQTILWKTEKETQVIFQGHDYAIDRVRSINDEKFVTGCQDGSIYLWSQRKKKPIYKNQLAHEGWVCSLSSLRQTNIFASGDSSRKIKIWSINDQMKGMTLLHEIESVGIVNDLVLRERELVGIAADECRLGRWWSHRVRNQIQVYKFKEE